MIIKNSNPAVENSRLILWSHIFLCFNHFRTEARTVCANDNIKILRSRRFKIAKKSRKYVTSCLVYPPCTYISLLYQFSCVLKQSDNNATRPSKDLGCTSKKISDFEICQNMQEIQILLGTCFLWMFLRQCTSNFTQIKQLSSRLWSLSLVVEKLGFNE